MPAKRNKYDREFGEGAARIVKETSKPIAQIARDLGINEGTLGNWVAWTGKPDRAPGFGAAAVKSRCSRSGSLAADGFCLVLPSADSMRRQGLVTQPSLRPAGRRAAVAIRLVRSSPPGPAQHDVGSSIVEVFQLEVWMR
jgi:hypothetical protein